PRRRSRVALFARGKERRASRCDERDGTFAGDEPRAHEDARTCARPSHDLSHSQNDAQGRVRRDGADHVQLAARSAGTRAPVGLSVSLQRSRIRASRSDEDWIMTLPETLGRWPSAFEIPVVWGDMDALGHVNNVTYLRWFES